MPGLWGSCFPCHMRRKEAKSQQRKLDDIEKDEGSRDGMAEELGGDTVTVLKWEENWAGNDQVSKPKPVRVHLRRPSSMGLGYKVGLVYDERMCAHHNVEDPEHPEKPERISAIYKRLEEAGIVEKCEIVASRDATAAELSCVHGKKHIDSMLAVSKHSKDKSSRVSLARKYNSVYFNDGSSKAALLAAGSCVEIALKVAKGELGAGAAVVRPPGHHAEADSPMGFCLFNNIAIAAHYIIHCQPALSVQKVLIVDWDVHHGNGTQHMFWKDPFVLYFSIHRYDYGFFYPSSEDGNSDKVGQGAGEGFNVNVPWQRRGYGDLDYLAVFDHLLMPIAQQFNPDMVFISGGFDSAAGDPLGGCKITPAGYFQMTQRLMSLAGGRVVLALEGGYNLESISASYLACMQALLGESFEGKISLELRASTWNLIREIRGKLLPYWSSLSTVLPDIPPEHCEIAEDVGLDSAYQDSVSVSEESGDELEEDDVEDVAARPSVTLQGDEQPGDLLSQMRSLDKSEEARLSSVQMSEVAGLAHAISIMSMMRENQDTEDHGGEQHAENRESEASMENGGGDYNVKKGGGNHDAENWGGELNAENGGKHSDAENWGEELNVENGGKHSDAENWGGELNAENGGKHDTENEESDQNEDTHEQRSEQPTLSWEALLDETLKSFEITGA